MNFTWFMLALAIVELIAVIVLLKKMKKRQIGREKRVLTFFAYLVISTVTIKFVVFPPVKEVKTTGTYQTAAEDYWLQTNQKGTDGENREIQIRVWYPEDYDGAQHSANVMVFSHGSCGTIDNNLSLYKELASHGYVVLAVAHEGHAASMKRENGKTISVSKEFLDEMMRTSPQENQEEACKVFKKWMEERMSDLNLVMDDFKEKAENSEAFYSRIADADEFIVAGHSAGGAAAYGMARTRDDICACIALESPFMYDIKGVENGDFVFDSSDYDIPVLSVYTDASYPYLDEWKQYKNNALFLNSSNSNYVNIYYPGIGHMGICDLSLASPLLSMLLGGVYPEVPAEEQLTQLNEDCLSFLDTYVKNESCKESGK